MLTYPNNNDFMQFQNIYQALVNAIIPRSPELAYEYGIVQYYGALDLQVEEYLVMTLDSFQIPLAALTAEIIQDAVIFVLTARNVEAPYSSAFGSDGIQNPFILLNALSVLTQADIHTEDLPEPFQNNPRLIASTVRSLASFTMMGYYSEWAGYGTTRLAEPNKRQLEFYPISWEQVGYPGPSLGYHALRPYRFT